MPNIQKKINWEADCFLRSRVNQLVKKPQSTPVWSPTVQYCVFKNLSIFSLSNSVAFKPHICIRFLRIHSESLLCTDFSHNCAGLCILHPMFHRVLSVSVIMWYIEKRFSFIFSIFFGFLKKNTKKNHLNCCNAGFFFLDVIGEGSGGYKASFWDTADIY